MRKFEPHFSASYPKRTYCVQYGESDFDFACRLMEEEGIYWYFSHKQDGHTLIVTDSKTPHEAPSGGDSVRYLPRGEGGDRGSEALDEWSPQHTVGAAAVQLTDFNFETPKPLNGKKNSQEIHPKDNAEVYTHPGRVPTNTEATRYAELRMEGERALRVTARGSGDVLGLTAGQKFTLTDFHLASENIDQLVVEARHRISLNAYHSGAAMAEAGRVDLVCIPYQNQFRPPQLTPRPRRIPTL